MPPKGAYPSALAAVQTPMPSFLRRQDACTDHRETVRTAGRSGWAERRFRRQPFILLSFSSLEKPQKRRKRSHTNVSSALVTRPSAPPAQTPQRSFQGAAVGTHAIPAPNRAHSGSQGETRGVLSGDAITTLGLFHTFRKPCAAGCQNGVLCRFWALVGCVPEERGEPAEQRCAHARRCPEASRPRWAA